MEAINTYLKNMFLSLPNSEEVCKAKEELRSMMGDKYEELKANGKTENEAIGIVISEFGNLEELAADLGLAGVMSEAVSTEEKPLIPMSEITEYLQANKKSAKGIARGVVLCILGVIPLLVLAGMAETGMIKETVANAIGLSVLLILVAIAVGLFIVYGMAIDKYDKYKKIDFSIDVSTQAFLTEEKNQYKPIFTTCITVGVILCIIGVIPLLVINNLFEKDTLLQIYSIAFLLLLVAIAVRMFVETGMRKDIFSILLQEDNYEKKSSNRVMDAIGGIYWMLVTAGYLAWSFITLQWNFTWIVWPIAGIIFAVISTIVHIVTTKDNH